MQRKAGHLVGFLDDFYIEAERRTQEPVQLPLLRTQPVHAFAQVEYGAIVNHLSGIVAPQAVTDASWFDLGHIPGDQPVHVRERVRAGDQMLGHRREVKHGAGIADRVVFHADVEVGIRHGVIAPAMPKVQLVQRRGARVEWSLQHRLMEMITRKHSSPFSRDHARRIAARAAHDTAAGMAAGTAQIQPSTGMAYCAAPGTGRSIMN